jgi:hypothetical protein
VKAGTDARRSGSLVDAYGRTAGTNNQEALDYLRQAACNDGELLP